MINKLSKDVNTKFLILGIYQVTGGIIGFVGIIIYLDNLLKVSLPLLLLFLFLSVAFFGYSIYSGIFLIKKKESGLTHSLINQCLQVFSFAMYGYAFMYMSGVYIRTGIDLTNSFRFVLDFGFSSWHVAVNSNEEIFTAHLNLVALYLLFFISRLEKKVKKEKIDMQLNEIGR